MKMYFDFGSLRIPAYGTMILIGVIVANIIAILLITLRDKHNIWDFIILEASGLLGAILGSKLLYIIVSFNDIPWDRIFEKEVIIALIGGGFVFYGGLILAIIFVLIMGRLEQIDATLYINNYVFLIPLAHAFGRIGCFFAGCCFGIKYDGLLSVIYPSDSKIAPPDIPLFPVQLVESACLFLIAISLFLLYWFNKTKYLMPIYFIAYGVVRFILEYFRFDEYRGRFLSLYTSQWISIFIIIVGVVAIVYRTFCSKSRT